VNDRNRAFSNPIDWPCICSSSILVKSLGSLVSGCAIAVAAMSFAPLPAAHGADNTGPPSREIALRVEASLLRNPGRIWECCSGGAIQGGAILSLNFDLTRAVGVEAVTGAELSSGWLLGGGLRLNDRWLLPAQRFSLAAALWHFQGPGVEDTDLLHFELGWEPRIWGPLSLFVAAGVDQPLHNVVGPGDEGEVDYRTDTLYWRIRAGVGVRFGTGL
jgi:hypothetical protein